MTDTAQWRKPEDGGRRMTDPVKRPDLNHAVPGKNRAYAVAQLAVSFMARGVCKETAWAWADAEVPKG